MESKVFGGMSRYNAIAILVDDDDEIYHNLLQMIMKRNRVRLLIVIVMFEILLALPGVRGLLFSFWD